MKSLQHNEGVIEEKSIRDIRLKTVMVIYYYIFYHIIIMFTMGGIAGSHFMANKEILQQSNTENNHDYALAVPQDMITSSHISLDS